jgi:DNA-3-methyladenine glycosylase
MGTSQRTQKTQIIPLSYYQHDDVVGVAKDLLGKVIFSKSTDGLITAGIITETEAYAGANDRASHAYQNRRTKRTEVMFHDGGVAYVYLCYGMHHLLNIVTSSKDTPHAVLIRAIHPLIGIDIMQERRKGKTPLASGPGLVCQALGIDKSHNGISLISDILWIENQNIKVNSKEILTTPRIGVDYAKEDALLPYRFLLENRTLIL